MTAPTRGLAYAIGTTFLGTLAVLLVTTFLAV